MAGGFLITLYEYSPLFYISVVSLCFVITAAMVLGWVGFDVPVILRSSDDTESILPTPEKQMVQVTNPFSLEMGSGSASVTNGVWLKPYCLEPCILSCFWGCEVSALQRALQAHQGVSRLSNPQHFREALYGFYHHCQSIYISSEDREERFICIPPEQALSDFGPLPRQRYPLVSVLTLAEQEARDTYNIVASVTVIHVPDDKYNLSARILFQYLLTSQGNMYELKALFMSANSGGESGHPTDPIVRPSEPEEEEETGKEVEDEEDDKGLSERQGKDCVVCQNAAINRVLLPCRHACVCDSCFSHFSHCPICRAFIQESFALTLGSAAFEQ
ncbi:cell growth regulator with RING finger domain protein 1 isoform X1 [Syngnathus scovelli]|uniref:cell growth regulator with RING finger domain protein 1 isoform X1 n=1 Tax=Syngnathus scovelli TaxID=161590 RepID=UPI00210F437E|nr:cell growth regulator with RING finger domain protein 1 isoform X1 [Syngnathus scovelli]